jgi:hypothetical protein
MIGTFCGRSVDDVLRRLESIGIKIEHRDRILVAFQDLLDPQTYSSHEAGSAQSVPASVRQYCTPSHSHHFSHSQCLQTAELHSSLIPDGHVILHADSVLESHVKNLNTGAVPVMKQHAVLGVKRCLQRSMAVRGATLFYADTAKYVLRLAASG